MSRPKRNLMPKKGRLNLTIRQETRIQLNYLANVTGKSISTLVEIWTEKESKKISKKIKLKKEV